MSVSVTKTCLCTNFGGGDQGAFAEHSSFLSKLGADVREVRLPHEFEGLDGIVLPGTRGFFGGEC